MKLARFTIGTHSPRCSGCPACSEDAARLLVPPSPPPDGYAIALRARVKADGTGARAALLALAAARNETDGYAVGLAIRELEGVEEK